MQISVIYQTMLMVTYPISDSNKTSLSGNDFKHPDVDDQPLAHQGISFSLRGTGRLRRGFHPQPRS